MKLKSGCFLFVCVCVWVAHHTHIWKDVCCNLIISLCRIWSQRCKCQSNASVLVNWIRSQNPNAGLCYWFYLNMSDSLTSLRPVVILLLLLCSFRECSKRAAEQAAAIVCLQSLGVHDGRSKTETAWCQWKSFKSGIEYMQTDTKSSRKISSSWLDPLFFGENTWSTGNRRKTEESSIQLFFSYSSIFPAAHAFLLV